MEISEVTMNNGKPGIRVDGIFLDEVEVDEKKHRNYEVFVFIESGVEHPDPVENESEFKDWVVSHAGSAIRCKDDQISRRPNIWPDETQHADVYRTWHMDNVSISIWTERAPKPPFIP